MHSIMDRIARLFAILGGLVLSLLIAQTCLSIAGRSINTILHSDVMEAIMPVVASALLATGVGAIQGAFELVEAGMAFVVFAFLPLCQLNGSHASVDIFTQRLRPRARMILQAAIEVVFAIVLVIIAWQLFQGLLSKYKSGQTTLILQFPVWWPYVFSLIAAIASVIIAIYMATMRLLELATRHKILPEDLEANR